MVARAIWSRETPASPGDVAETIPLGAPTYVAWVLVLVRRLRRVKTNLVLCLVRRGALPPPRVRPSGILAGSVVGGGVSRYVELRHWTSQGKRLAGRSRRLRPPF